MREGFVGKPLDLDHLAFHHDDATGGRPSRQLWLSNELWTEADLFVTSRNFDARSAPLGWNSEPHVHDVSQTYMLIPSAGTFTASVLLDGNEETIDGPATISIAAGTTHALRIVDGAGTIISIVRKGFYP